MALGQEQHTLRGNNAERSVLSMLEPSCVGNEQLTLERRLLSMSAASGNDPASTVLAQDHFFSDFLSLHLTSKTHKVAMMMLVGSCLQDFALRDSRQF